MNRIRVVVADQAEAIFYDIASLKACPVEVARLSDPEARRHARDMGNDRPGRTYESVGGQRHALGDESSDARRLQARNFARAIAANLDADRRNRRFEQLIVVASAPFRSLMRAEFSDATKASVVYEVPKDLVHSHVEVLRDYLPASAQELKSA
jgi:protein required for attachment to host cells